MGLTHVKEELNKKANLESEKIIQEGKTEADSILQSAKEELKKLEETQTKETETKIESLRKQETTASKMSAQKMIFAKKKELIEKLKQDTLEKLCKSKKKPAMVKALLAKAKNEIKIGSIECKESDKPMFKGHKTVSGNMKGGFVAYDSSKTISVDYTFETLLDELFEKKLGDFAKTLFG